MAGFDVVVAGSGPAGSATAALMARAGLTVALLEAHHDPRHYKRLCTHFIQSSALPVMQRLGLDARIEAAGGVRNHGNMWTRYGWIREPPATDRPPHGYSLRRQTLDPMLREIAAATPGVELVLGAKVQDVTRNVEGRVDGVLVNRDGSEERIAGRLVVGADGWSSRVADRAGLPAVERPNARFGYFAQYRNIEIPGGRSGQIWLRPPDACYTFANEDGITVLAVMPPKQRIPDFDEDREGALLAMFRDLPEAPDLSRAVRVSDVLGTKDYPSKTRKRVVAPGVALVGDAAMVGDPLWGVGCGFALQSAAWLTDSVADPLLDGDGDGDRDRDRANARVDKATRAYQRRHRRRFGPHQNAMVDFSSGRDFNALERLVFAGAALDEKVASGMWAFGTRNASPASLRSPALLARAAWQARRAPRDRSRNAGSPVLG